MPRRRRLLVDSQLPWELTGTSTQPGVEPLAGGTTSTVFLP